MSISILQVKDKNGKFVSIPAIKGDKGADGTMTFSDLTDEQKASLKGEDGVDGLTPFIGANGNWWIGTTDTGIKASADVQVATGSYQGTGDNTIVLSFNFVPKCILIEGDSPKEFGFLVPTAGRGFAIEGYVSGTDLVAQTQGITCTVSGNTVTAKTLYNILSAGSPNVATYNYVAIG